MAWKVASIVAGSSIFDLKAYCGGVRPGGIVLVGSDVECPLLVVKNAVASSSMGVELSWKAGVSEGDAARGVSTGATSGPLDASDRGWKRDDRTEQNKAGCEMLGTEVLAGGEGSM